MKQLITLFIVCLHTLYAGDLTFLAAPYYDPDPSIRDQRIDIVNQKAADMMQKGESVVCVLSHWIHLQKPQKLPVTAKFWYPYCEELVKRCDKLSVLTLDGWDKSPGVLFEIEVAKRENIPIEYVMP